MILALATLCVAAPTHAADAAPGVRRAQVAAANADAVDAIRRDVLSTRVTPDMTVEQFIKETDSRDVIDQAVRRAEQIGGTRWLDDQTCQVRMELPGGQIADALVQIAEAKPHEAGLPADAIRKRVETLRDRTFAATGMSTSAIERLRPGPDQPAWRAVPADAVRAAVADARQNAATQVLGNLDSVALPAGGNARLGAVLADAKVRGVLEGWLLNQPVTSADFRDDLEVRVSIATDGESFWNELSTAVADRKDLGFPTDPDARAELRRQICSQVGPTVGRAVAKVDTPTTTTTRALQTVPMQLDDVPRDPPRWVATQIEAKATSRPADGRLKTARAAETAARDDLRKRIDALQLSRKLTIGETAKRDDRVRTAVDRVVRHARPRKVNYLSDGGAEVTFSVDLRELWYELESR